MKQFHLDHRLNIFTMKAEKIVQATTCETLSKRVVLVDKNVVSLGVVAESSSSTATAVSNRVTLDEDHHSCIYKPTEMARSTVCLRHLLLGSFILLGISGAVVCGTGSYFFHQLHSPLNPGGWYGPPGILLSTGIINAVLGPYFWFFIDTKYNKPQFFMFFILLVLVMMIESGAGLWALMIHKEIDSSITNILENNLASIGKIDGKADYNISEIKANCCGFENLAVTNGNDRLNEDNDELSWSCCDTRNHKTDFNDISEDTCAAFYIIECREFALHNLRAVLLHVFLLALSSIILQIIVIIFHKCYWTITKKSYKKKRTQSVVATINPASSKMICSAATLGPQHVCEGCSASRYHER